MTWFDIVKAYRGSRPFSYDDVVAENEAVDQAIKEAARRHLFSHNRKYKLLSSEEVEAKAEEFLLDAAKNGDITYEDPYSGYEQRVDRDSVKEWFKEGMF